MTDLFGQPLVEVDGHAMDLRIAQAEAIYKAYPRHVDKPPALRAIRRAVAKFGYDFILERTRQYAACVASWPRQDTCFVPYPATFFNRHRFNDNPSTWLRTSGIGALKAQLAAIEIVIGSHVANVESAYHDADCTQAQKNELDDLKRKRMDIFRQIANH